MLFNFQMNPLTEFPGTSVNRITSDRGDSSGAGTGPGPGAGPTGITSVRGDSIDRSPRKFSQWIHLKIEKHLKCLLWKLTFCVSDGPLWRIPWKFGHGLTPGRG